MAIDHLNKRERKEDLDLDHHNKIEEMSEERIEAGEFCFRFRTESRRVTEENGIDRPSGGQGNNPGNNLHVSGLSTRVDDRDLEEIFGRYGRVS